MKRLVEYQLEDGGAIVAEIDDNEPGVERATRADNITAAADTFQSALAKVRPATNVILQQFRDLADPPTEVTVDFGIRLNVKAGAVIASSEGEGHFQVTLTWTRPSQVGG
jgi:hypothetical protein